MESRSLLERIFSIDGFKTPVNRDRAKVIYATTLVVVLLFTLYSAFLPGQVNGGTIFSGFTVDALAFLTIIGMYSMAAFTYVSTRAGSWLLSGLGVCMLWFFTGVMQGFRDGFVHPGSVITLIALVMFSGLFLYEKGLIAFSIIAFLTPGLRFLLGSNGTIAGEFVREVDLVPLQLQILGSAVIVYLFLRVSRLSRDESMTSISEERMKLAAITTDITSLVLRRQALADVLNTAVQEIRERYPAIYHAQIFLIDPEGVNAQLAASTGEVGKMLLNRKHSLQVGSTSVIGKVTELGQSVVARAGATDGIHRRNELLPDTMVELALPLRVGESIIGALDLQSKYIDAFPEAEMPIFNSLADSIAVAIDNARLSDATAAQLAENERLLGQLQDTVNQVEQLNRQLTQKAWRDYLSDHKQGVNLDYDPARDLFVDTVNDTPTLTRATSTGAMARSVSAEGDIITVAVPIRIRGQVIGAVELDLDATTFANEDVDLLEAVSERFGLAAENARLYDDAQKATQQEQRVNDIAARYQQVSTIDELLAITVAELSDTLGARKGAIRIGRLDEDAENGDHTENGGTSR